MIHRRPRCKRLQITALSLSCLLAPVVSVHAAPINVTSAIHVDQFGYLPRMQKVAIIAKAMHGLDAPAAWNPGTVAGDYEVRRWADDAVVLKGSLQTWRNGAEHVQSGDKGWHFDFSALTVPGSYYVFDTRNRVASGRFEIGDAVYAEVLRQAMRTFFYQRLGQAKYAPYAEFPWLDGIAITEDQRAQDHCILKRTCSNPPLYNVWGGWMDAGDPNKYTTFALRPVLQLLNAFRLNPQVFSDQTGLPESGNGLPDVLDELRWELAFLKRMQDGTRTGGLLLKVGVTDYKTVTPPSQDHRVRYVVPECTSATLSGAAMFALASVVFKTIPSLASEAADFQRRAELAWNRARITAQMNPSTGEFTTFQTDCDQVHDVGGWDEPYVKAGDADMNAVEQRETATTAAIYLYEATGNTNYRDYALREIAKIPPLSAYGYWGPYDTHHQAAQLRFAKAGQSAWGAVSTTVLNSKAASIGLMSRNDYVAKTDLYLAHLNDDQYHWGSNMMHAAIGVTNLDFPSFGLRTSEAALFRDIADQHLHWLHGANPLNLVMLSNMGRFGAEKSINQLFHAWFFDGSRWDSAEVAGGGPAPGFLTGGPNPSYSGPLSFIRQQPRQKAYWDWNNHAENSYELSEPAIYYQAAYVELLARTITPPSAPTAWIYDDQLGNGWTDWSWWSSSLNVYAPERVLTGNRAIKATINKQYGGISLRHATGVPFNSTSVIGGWVFSPKAVTLGLYTQINDESGSSPMKSVSVPANRWTYVGAKASELGSPTRIKRFALTLQDSANATLYLDHWRVDANPIR